MRPTRTPALAQDHTDAIQRQDIDKSAYEIEYSPTLDCVFVASVPDFSAGAAGFVHVLDGSNLRPLRQIRLSMRAFALALDDAAGRLYVGHTMDGALGVLDVRDGQFLGQIQLGQSDPEGNVEHTRMIALDAANGRAFVTGPTKRGVVWIVDTQVRKLLHRIDDAGIYAAGAAFDPTSGRFYSSGGGAEEIAILDATGARLGRFATGEGAEGELTHFFVNLAIDIEGQRLFAADATTQTVHVFDIASGAVVARIPVGPGTLDLVFNAARAEIYATYRGITQDDPHGTGGIAIIDAQSYEVKAHLPIAAHPNSLALNGAGDVLYLTAKAPHDEGHPAYVKDAPDSVFRIDLPMLLGSG